MASIDCLWGNFAIVLVNYLAFDDSPFCYGNAMDYCYSLQHPHSISNHVLLFERLGFR